MNTLRTAAIALAFISAAPLGAQTYGGSSTTTSRGDSLSRTRSAVTARPQSPATRSSSSTAPAYGRRATAPNPLESRSSAYPATPAPYDVPMRDPRDTPAPRATGGGSYGPLSVSSWGGAPGASRATAAPSAAKNTLAVPAPPANAKPAPQKP